MSTPAQVQQIDGQVVTRLRRPQSAPRITTVRGGLGTLQNQDGGGTVRLDYSNEVPQGGSAKFHFRVADAAGDACQVKAGSHAPQRFVDGDVDVAGDSINIDDHGFYLGQLIQMITSGTLPAGLAITTDFFVIVVDKDNFQVATSLANALAGTQVDITAAAGGGNHDTTGWHNVAFPPNDNITDGTGALFFEASDGWQELVAADSVTIQGEGVATVIQHYWE